MKLRIILTAAALGLATSASAHHSGAMFDQSKLIELKGTLIEYKIQQPHSWLSLRTEPGKPGGGVRWDVEAASAGTMRRMGLTPSVIKPGMPITVQIHPMRDGRNGGSLVALVSNGRTYTSDYTKNGYSTGRPDDDGGAKVKDR